MTDAERGLLLTTARLLRAHLNDHVSHGNLIGDVNMRGDLADISEALAPFDPSPQEAQNFGTPPITYKGNCGRVHQSHEEWAACLQCHPVTKSA